MSSDDYGLNILLFQAGIGPDNARDGILQFLSRASWDVIISTGFAGDLNYIPIGSIVIGDEVCRESDIASHASPSPFRIACHSVWIQRALSLAIMEGQFLQTGKYVSTDHILTHSIEKHQLKTSTGAVAVDMESAAIGEVAHDHGLPFLIVRTISDGVNENLPVDFNLFLKPAGWLSGVMYILSNPRSWSGFLDLYRHSKKASLELTKFFREFFFAVSSRDSSTS